MKMTPMNNRVYGILISLCSRGNFNADFYGNPRKQGDTYVATPFSIKYAFRDYLDKNGEKVFYIKSFKADKGKISPMQMKGRYETLFEKKLENDSSLSVAKDLFTCIDVINFGGTFAESKNNLSITGAVQFTEGVNLYAETETIREDILSPFANSKKDDANNTTLGSRAIVDEAHYAFGFSINPSEYRNFVEAIEEFEGYTKEAYEAFKEASLYAVTEMNSVAKVGCENECSIFVECKEESKVVMANLHQYVDFYKEDGMGVIDLTRLNRYLNCHKAHIDKIEVYYNQITTKIKGINEELNYNLFSILNREPISLGSDK